MNSTSFQSNPGGPERFNIAHEADAALHDSLAASDAHAAEARRMKAFAGQRRFQAPVADDFARGMLAQRPAGNADTTSLRHANGVWAALMSGLTALRRG
ncbi:type III secretion protein [Pseudomonas kitaguniensis]|nr:type III secretion protein [Pseudomonas kitaguniensis]